MTTEEFIEAVNSVDNRDNIDAVIIPIGIVFLRKCRYVIATLGELILNGALLIIAMT